jgi:hypothetical protein
LNPIDPTLWQKLLTAFAPDGWTNLIAIFAFCVSCLSAWLAWRSAKSAKRANLIAIHEYQLNLYRAFNDAYDHIKQNGIKSNYEELKKLSHPVKTSGLYVTKHLSKKLTLFYLECEKLHDLKNDIKRATSLCNECDKRIADQTYISVEENNEYDAAFKLLPQLRLMHESAIPILIYMAERLHKEFITELRLT